MQVTQIRTHEESNVFGGYKDVQIKATFNDLILETSRKLERE